MQCMKVIKIEGLNIAPRLELGCCCHDWLKLAGCVLLWNKQLIEGFQGPRLLAFCWSMNQVN